MALQEKTVLKSVEVVHSYSPKTVQVAWEEQITRDGEVISSNIRRCAYSQEQKDAFISEVEGAAAYLPLLGW